MKVQQIPLLILSISASLQGIEALSLSTSPSESAKLAKYRLQESLSSISGKLTLSPEIVLPEPNDPTALLLQASEVTKLSTRIRTSAKANAAWVAGSLNTLKSFCAEQETARGNFPGPVPVIFCDSAFNSGSEDKDENSNIRPEISELAQAGVSGLLSCVLGGKEISSVDEIETDEELGAAFASAIENGIQLIPEVVLSPEKKWSEEDVTSLVEAVCTKCGGDEDPACIVLTVNPSQDNDDDSESNASDENDEEELLLPIVSKEIKKRLPILGSVRALAGGNRMGSAVADLKKAGFTGAFLRSDCVPGFRMNPDLDFVGGFWSAAIGDLKSTKSKNFNFRSKVQLDRDIPLEWYNYQKDVMESGALGSPGGGGPDPLDTDNGDYQGF